MNLTTSLKNSGYDLLEGITRPQNIGQLWLKRPFKVPDFQYEKVEHAFTSGVELVKVTNSALDIDFSLENTFKFNIGITVLNKILSSIGLAELDFSVKIKSGRSISIKFDNTTTSEYTLGNMQEYFLEADFNHTNHILLENLNKNLILILSGVIEAKNLIVDVKTNSVISFDLKAELNEIANGKATFEINHSKNFKMTATPGLSFPIAVKIHEIFYDKGEFKKLKLISDVENTFF